jgi:hypothetical protein
VIVLSYLSLIMSQSHPPALIPAACPLVRGVHPQAVESFRALPSHGVCLPSLDASAVRPALLARLTSAPPSAGTPPCDTPPGPIWRAPLTARTLLALPPLLTPRQPPGASGLRGGSHSGGR